MVNAEPPAGPVTCTYNARYQRVQKHSPTGVARRFIYDFKRLLQETDADDDPLSTYTQCTTHEYGDLVGEYDESSASARYPTYDAQLNTHALLDDAA